MATITEITHYTPSISKKVALPRGTSFDIGTPRLEKKLSVGDMAMEACRKMHTACPSLERKKLAIIVSFASTSGEFYGSIATRIQYELNLPPSTKTYQITGGCYVSLQALELASTLLNADRELEGVLVVGVDNLSRFVTPETQRKRASSTMWGDGACAVLVESKTCNGLDLTHFLSRTQGETWHDCTIEFDPRFNQMAWDFKNPQEELYYNDRELSYTICLELLQKAKQEASELKGLVLLNRSRRFAQSLADDLGLPSNKVVESFVDLGHLGCVDLLINLDFVLKQENYPQGDYLVFSSGYGYIRCASILTKR